MSAALVDASSLVAAFSDDPPRTEHYRLLFKLANDERWKLSSTWPCVVEASHLVVPTKRYAMLRWIASGGLSVFPFAQEALEEMVELMRRYTQQPRTEMDLADASLVCLAADTGVTTIMTLDVHDFSRYRLPDGRGFDII